MKETTYNPLAQALNDRLEKAAPEVFAMLSALGKRLYFPKGILSQGAEAKQKGKRINATIGIATEGKGPMYLPSLHAAVSGVSPEDAYNYAPPSGRPDLRDAWRKKLLRENPSLEGKEFGLPIVTSAITHGIALVGDLFVDAGDIVLMPDQLWGNYRLTYEVRLGAQVKTFPFFAGQAFDSQGFRDALESARQRARQADRAAQLPEQPDRLHADRDGGPGDRGRARRAGRRRGTKLVVLCDDAYFGLFYHLGGRSMTESLFGRLTNLHPNLLAVKLDGATKELFVWGLRCGFITFGPGRAERSADGARSARRQGARRHPRRGLEQPAALADARREGAALAVDRRRAQGEARPARARAREVHRVAHAAALPRRAGTCIRSTAATSCDQGEGRGRRTRCACTCSTSTRPDSSRPRPPTCASRSRASRSSRSSRSSRPCIKRSASSARSRALVHRERSRSG